MPSLHLELVSIPQGTINTIGVETKFTAVEMFQFRKVQFI